MVLPFGLTNAPATFMSLMHDIFQPFLVKFVLIFIDDILIYSRTEEEHEQHLKIVLWTLREYNLYAKFDKCDLYQRKIQYLCHVISKDRIVVDPGNIRAIMECHIPKYVAYIRSFMGITNY